MNPSNPFGGSQSGAFQSPGSTVKTSLFQPIFGQQSSANPSQQTATTPGFLGTGFGQPSSLSVFGQAPAFGQTTAAPQQQQQAPAFGQQQSGPVFAPVFGQTQTPSNQSSVFGQAPSFGGSFGQPSGFGQGFGSQTSGFGTQPAPQFGQPAAASSGVGFGQPVFGQPTSTAPTTSIFGTSTSNVTQSRGFGSSEFSFKPSNEALFKPIISVSPEPTTTTLSNSPFGAATTSTASGFFSTSKPATTGFSFSQPAALPAAPQPLASTSTGAPTGGLQFTFSQPAAPSSNKGTTNQPTTPSSFSFTAKTLQSQSKSLFGASKFGQTFGDAGIKEGEDNESSSEPTVETNVFARLSKPTEHKDVEEATEEKVASGESDSSRQQPKRPLVRSRGPPVGLFGRALSGLRRDATGAPKRESKHLDWEETEGQETVRQRAATPPATTAAVKREQVEKPQETDPAPSTSTELQTPPAARASSRRESTESLSDSTVLQCRNLPPELNQKGILMKHFQAFGKVHRVYCKPQRNMAFIHFGDHASAVKAKRNGKMLREREVMLLWQKKKQSPGGSRGPHQQRLQADRAEPEQVQTQNQSPLRRPALRAPALCTTVSFSSPVKKSRCLQFEDSPEPVPDFQVLERTMERTVEHTVEHPVERPVERSVERPVERPVPSSLLHLVGQMAETVEEKYQLLEQRDKILRQGRPKRTDLNLSKVFVGTCPDMCPEKERYMRETRKQLSIYEVLPNTEMVDHAAAIKEYSRSSADQEEPLPHELRPLPVLSQTMDYLVTQILDQGQDNYRDWYDFVWNRTRGIRKDITQQHLCCPTTVSLIEKCVRFHVHCAHELCEEHMSTFDAKINNENMTKCLQSLKEMYQDLSNSGVYCPQEAEIRQYNVLLNLNDGDILREVQQFRDPVRNSPEVKFAVQVFSAVNNHNFVRFFKLVKAASYLSSCLLHRYFYQVRSRALKRMNAAYTVGNRSTVFPLDDIVRMLMFPNEDEASAFIQQHGLNVSDGVVELNRTSFQDPELPVSSRRSEVILYKRKVLIGEVVNGGPLPSPPQHRPVCSFDADNKFRGEQLLPEPPPYKAPVALRPPAPEAQPVFVRTQERPPVFGPALVQSAPPQPEAEETGEPSPSVFLLATERRFQPIPQPEPPIPVKVPTPPPPKPVYTDEDIEAELNHMVEEVTDAAVREVADAAVSYTSAALEVSFDQVEALVCEVTQTLLKEISSEEVKLEQERIAEEKRRIEQARRKREHEAFLIDYSFSLCTELIYEVLDETIKKTAASEIQEAVDEKTALVARCTEEVCAVLIEDTLDSDVAVLVKELLDVELQRIHKYIKRWRDVVAVRRQLKRQMRAFPAAPCFVDPRCKLRALAPSAQNSIELLSQGLVNLGHAGTLSVNTTRLLKIREEVMHKLKVYYFHQLLIDEASWAPLDLPALATKHLLNPAPEIFWKCLLLMPSEHETASSESDSVLCDWLAVKLGAESRQLSDGILHNLRLSSSTQETPHHTHSVHISIKVSYGPLSEDGLSKMEECQELQGAGALLMLLPLSLLLTPLDQDEALLSALLQLKQLQQANTWHCPLPLVILVPSLKRGEGQTDGLAEALMLPKLVEEGLISEYIFYFLPETTSDLQGSRQLAEAVCWLFSRAPPAPPLSCQTLVQLVESSLSREVSSRVYAHRQERASSALPPQRPLPVIHLYNAALKHIAECVSSPELTRLSWPPLEFCESDNPKSVPPSGWNCPEHLSWIRDAILSLQLPLWDHLAPTDSWSELCSSIRSYAAQLLTSSLSQPLLMSRLDNLLERFRVQSGRSPGAHIPQSVPWDDVLEICIDHKLKDWKVSRLLSCEDTVTDDGEILVYFLSDTLSSFSAPDEWTEAIKQTHKEKYQPQERAGGAAWAPAPPPSLQKRLFFSPKEPDDTPEPAQDLSYTLTPEEAQAHRVQQQLQEERQRSKRVMEKFQSWSEGEALLQQLHFPMFMPSSTLLSTPTLVLPPTGCTRKTPVLAQVFEPEDSPVLPKSSRLSSSWRLEDVEREIRASQEEERVCQLHLSFLQSIVND